MKTALLGLFAFAATLFSSVGSERFLMYKVERITPGESPKVDGRLDDAVWKGRPAIATLRNFLGPLTGEFASQRSEFVVLTDGVKLFIGATFYDDDMKKILFNPANAPFWNDCTEIYFDPRHDGTRSIQLVVDCGGQRMWEKKFDDGYGWWDDNSWNLLADWQSAVARFDDRWTIEIAINLASFGIDATPGKTVGFNPARFRLGAAKQEFSCWGMGSGELGRQKHMPSWGHLIFAEPEERGQGSSATREDLLKVFPDLGDRVFDAPAEGGLTLFDKNGTRKILFKDMLAPQIKSLEEKAGKTGQAVSSLPPEDPRRKFIDSKLKEASAKLPSLKAESESASISIGQYDRIAEVLMRLDTEIEELYWQTRIAQMVLDKK